MSLFSAPGLVKNCPRIRTVLPHRHLRSFCSGPACPGTIPGVLPCWWPKCGSWSDLGCSSSCLELKRMSWVLLSQPLPGSWAGRIQQFGIHPFILCKKKLSPREERELSQDSLSEWENMDINKEIVIPSLSRSCTLGCCRVYLDGT